MKHTGKTKIRKQIISTIVYILCLAFCLFNRQYLFAVLFTGLAVFNAYQIYKTANSTEEEEEQEVMRKNTFGDRKQRKQEYEQYLEKINSEFDFDYDEE